MLLFLKISTELSELLTQLNDNQIQQLHDLGVRLEKAFNYPQDIEWAINNDVIHRIKAKKMSWSL